MANWREKGVVPDSDDEDALDSQSTANHEDAQSGERSSDPPSSGMVIGTRGFEEEVEKDSDQSDSEALDASTPAAYDGLREQPIPLPLPSNKSEESSKANVDGSGSSQTSPKVFKIPRLFWELEEDDVPASDPESGKQAGDEISTSYVQITSPTSSILSSLPRSQVSLPQTVSVNRRGPTTPPSGTLFTNPAVDNHQAPGTTTYTGRSLRQRNPIQLHPYIVEQEKYRQTLKARGIAPMRIEPFQDETQRWSRLTASPDLDSQERDSRDATEAGDSQSMDFDWNPLFSSSPQRASETYVATDAEIDESIARDNGEDEGGDGDEEFPDIDELLSNRLPILRSVGPKGEIKSYSTKSKRKMSSMVRTRPTGVTAHEATPSSIFFPASPPATSSPNPATSRVPGSSRARLRSPAESIHIGLAQNGLDIQKSTDLPTPATSVIKPIPISVESDSENLLASIRDVSSSDESVQIRKVSKKIRGVLPASHLRLDYQQKKPQAASRTHRDSLSVSPIKASARRGIALPKTHDADQSRSAFTAPGFEFLSDDSESEDAEKNGQGFIVEDNSSSPLDSLFSQSRLGFAEEDDRIDAMLPSRKRKSTSYKAQQRKKYRVNSSSLFQVIDKSYTNQPKITQHLKRPRQSAIRKISRQAKQPASPHGSHENNSSLPRKPVPPRLGILDVADFSQRNERPVPKFIKIAARTARSKIGQGKQSPSRKFIRLANREDTHDVQSVLENWREGRIQARLSDSPYSRSVQVLGRPLREIDTNRQTKLQATVPKMILRPKVSYIEDVGVRRKLIISRGQQQSMNTFITREQAPTQPAINLVQDRTSKLRRCPTDRPRCVPPSARFAQLESSEGEYSRRHPATAFRSTKKTLDALYRRSCKQPVPHANLQLSRFLADDDVVRLSIKPKISMESATQDVRLTSNSSIDHLRDTPRRKKRPPRRLDAGAAVYRQPSDPLFLEFLSPACPPDISVEGCKLLGLAKFGTPYPLNFDIFPLRPGVFFHESTFIGSGRLSEAIQNAREVEPGLICPQTSLVLAGKTFSWGKWSEDVSSEMGLSFDWLVDQLVGPRPTASSPPTIDAAGVISFALEYAHCRPSFAGVGDVKNFLCRMIEILQDVSYRLETSAESSKYVETRSWIEVTSMSTLLLLELLRMARVQHEERLAYKLEDLLKKFAAHCVKTLLSQGLDRVRKLYDDLQYLSFRESGIDRNEYVVQAWVIIMKVLDAAQIPRGSFWDITNPQLLDINVKDMNDARVMEKLWYSMFSLLPLCEFDEFGMVIEGQRQVASFDNWLLPQRMLKSVFDLYSSNQRQSPGFNDYCRSIVSRCHYLMVEWGWWNSTGVIGTLFDFFGSQNFSHLRNEEAYASPHFLQELDGEPHLGLEPEDRCFHIFLKIVALAIRRFRQTSDGKTIRNLVARLMPNHNRQYPKEESIHQRDLASLRNHHDLLCTLYWAAPLQYRPSPALIQELVVVDHSHKEACLINLRAWEQLARFVLTHAAEEAAYQPLNLWHRDFFSALLQQYLRVESEIRDQAHALEGTSEKILHENQLQEVIKANRATMMATMCSSVKAVSDLVRDAQDTTTMIKPFLTLDLSKAFDPQLGTYDKPSRFLLDECLQVITNYMDRVESLRATSQKDDNIRKRCDWLVQVLKTTLALPFPNLVRRHLEATLDPIHRTACVDKLYKKLVTCWGRYIALVTDRDEERVDGNYLDEYITTGPNSVFENRLKYDLADHYWPYFLAELLKHKRSVDLENAFLPVLDFGREWLLTLTKLNASQSFHVEFTAQLQKRGFTLSQGIPANYPPTQKLRGAIRTMGRHMVETLTHKTVETKARYSSMLVDIMKSMQQHLEGMEPTGPKYENYLKFVQKVAADIKCYSADICQLSLFFLVPSNHYRPDQTDPEFFAAGILKYCLRLGQQRERTSFELFYYLLGGWKKAFVSGKGKIHNHISHIKKAMKHPDFINFLFADFIPAILRTGFRSIWTHASMVYLAYLPVLAFRASELLSGDEPEARSTFRLIINILRIIMNCLLAGQDYSVIARIPCPQRLERSVRTVACQFWLEVAPFLMNYTQRFRTVAPEDEFVFLELHHPFLHYMERMAEHLDPPYLCQNDWMIPAWPVEEGEYCAKFEAALEEDIRGCQTVQGCREIRIGPKVHLVTLSDYEETMPTFEAVLQYGCIGCEMAIPKNSFIRDVMP